MKLRFSLFISLLFLIILLVTNFYVKSNEKDNSWIINYIQRNISTEDRKVQLIGVSGALSSKAHINEIIISDRKGLCLDIKNISLNWSRSALLKRTLKINTLNIGSLNFIRKPENDKENILDKLSNIDLSSLPINFNIKSISINKLYYKQAIYEGYGSLKLLDGKLNSIFHISQLNHRSYLDFNTQYSSTSKHINIDLNFFEASHGVFSTLIDPVNAPDLHFSIKGNGITTNLRVNVDSAIGNKPGIKGYLTIHPAATLAQKQTPKKDSEINLMLAGPIRILVPDAYKPLFAQNTSLRINSTLLQDNSININNVTISGSIIHLNANARILADGFVRRLFVNASLVDPATNKQLNQLTLPKLAIKLNTSKLVINYGYNQDNKWNANLTVHNFRYNNSIPYNVDLNIDGIADNLEDPSARHIQVILNGILQNSSNKFKLTGNIESRADAPVLLQNCQLIGKQTNIDIEGSLYHNQINLFTKANIGNLKYLGDVLHKDWHGSLNITDDSNIYISKAHFAIAQNINAKLNNIYIGDLPDKAETLLKNPTQISGDIKYTGHTDFAFNNFAIINKDLSMVLNGNISAKNSHLDVKLDKANLNLLQPKLKGIVNGTATLNGEKQQRLEAILDSNEIAIDKVRIIRPNVNIDMKLQNFKPYDGHAKITGLSENKNKINLKFDLSQNHNLKLSAQNLPAILAQPFVNFGIPNLPLGGSAELRGNKIEFEISGNSNDNASKVWLAGDYNLKGKTINSKAKLKLPVSLLNPILKDKELQLNGDFIFNGEIKGTVKIPKLYGSAYIQNGNIIDSKHNIQVNDVYISAKANGNKISITKGEGKSKSGGKVYLTGTIYLENIVSPISTLSLKLYKFHYGNSKISFISSGDLSLNGNLCNQPKLSGEIIINNGNILISRDLSAETPIEVKHINTNNKILNTLKRAHMQQISQNSHLHKGLLLNLNVRAPGNIYIRGMGLNAEIMGATTIQGPSEDLQTTGLFSIVKARLNLFSKNFTFTNGDISIDNKLQPHINFTAEATINSLTTIIHLYGNLNDIKIDLSSSPTMPKDEILAHLLFNRSVKELSAFQLAKIVTEISALTGKHDFIGNIEAASKMDNLDFDKDEEGNIGVSAGRYITDNIYTSIGATQKGTTKATITWDLPHNFKATGQYSTDNSNKFGLSYNNDY